MGVLTMIVVDVTSECTVTSKVMLSNKESEKLKQNSMKPL